MQLNIVFGDIFTVSCDAYVNPTDLQLSGGGGLDKAIHAKAGAAFARECAALRGALETGRTGITSGGDLPVKYVLHTVSPKCAEETGTDYAQLAACYENILATAACKRDLHHLAIPLVGTGIGGYSLQTPAYGKTPYSLTAVTILSAIFRYNREMPHTVTIVCASKEKYEIMQRTLRWISGKGISRRSRIRGSLLAGAAGDALGYPVEFFDAEDARIEEYVLDQKTGAALISDDTQMTLFTACGLLWGCSRSCMKGIGGDIWYYVAYAYEDWLKTQYPDFEKQKFSVSWIRNIPELNARRAPGNTCLSALEEGGGSIDRPINDSKGCGGVMRIAPLALYGASKWPQVYNLRVCAETAAITHGHPLGWLSAAALGNILFDIMQNFSISYAVEDTVHILRQVYSAYPDTETMVRILRKTADLAERAGWAKAYDLMAEFDVTTQLGEGWVGEEALAVGLFCVMATLDSGFDRCVHNAVWHKGDSDSTGSIAGQIWGAYFGEEALPQKWLRKLELRDVIAEIGDDLTNDCRMSEYSPYYDAAWVRKYLSGEDATHIPGSRELLPHKYIQLPWSEETNGTCEVYKYDFRGEVCGKYRLQIHQGTIYHVARTKEEVQTGSPGFGFVTLKYDREKQIYTEHHGFVKKDPSGIVQGYYNNCPFMLMPNRTNRTVEIFSHTSPNPWIGTIRRRFDEWNNPIEIEFKDAYSGISAELLGVLVKSKEYLREFFR